MYNKQTFVLRVTARPSVCPSADWNTKWTGNIQLFVLINPERSPDVWPWSLAGCNFCVSVRVQVLFCSFCPQRPDDAGWWFCFGQRSRRAVNNVNKAGGSRKKTIYSLSCFQCRCCRCCFCEAHRETIMSDDFNVPPSEPQSEQETARPCWHTALGWWNPAFKGSGCGFDGTLLNIWLWCWWEHYCNESFYLCCMIPKYYE